MNLDFEISKTDCMLTASYFLWLQIFQGIHMVSKNRQGNDQTTWMCRLVRLSLCSLLMPQAPFLGVRAHLVSTDGNFAWGDIQHLNNTVRSGM